MIRFVFGGLVTVAAGLIATIWGPLVGGLFLAFPSILPASLTLVAKQTQLSAAAGATALGAACGSAGLLAFAVVGGGLIDQVPGWLALGLAAASWALVAGATWVVLMWWHQHKTRAARSSPSSGSAWGRHT
jgi:hypothetical protein